MKELPEYIEIKINGRKRDVKTSGYITAKTKQLIEFGYSTLKENDVQYELLKLFNDEKVSIIGKFMEDEIILTNQIKDRE